MKKIIKETYLLTKEDKHYFELKCKELNLTKYAVAKKLKITPTYLSYILDGKRAFSEVILNQFRDLGFSFTEE